MKLMNVEHRTLNECILSVLKRLSEAKPSFEILRFAVPSVIRIISDAAAR